MPASSAIRKDTIRARTAAASAAVSVSGPTAESWSSCWFCPLIKIRQIEETRPAPAQTAADTAFGLIPCSRARAGLSAEASTALPSTVRFSSSDSARAMTGTTTTIAIWVPVIWTVGDSRQTPAETTG